MPGQDYFISYCFHNFSRDQNYVVFLSPFNLKERDGNGIKIRQLSNKLAFVVFFPCLYNCSSS